MKIFFWEIFLADFFLEIFLNTFLFFGENFFDKNISGENISGENIFAKNIYAKNIFFFGGKGTLQSTPYTTPTSSYLLFEVEGGGTNERTYGPDAHTYCLFYCIR